MCKGLEAREVMFRHLPNSSLDTSRRLFGNNPVKGYVAAFCMLIAQFLHSLP
jgi:hypothetical protein